MKDVEQEEFLEQEDNFEEELDDVPEQSLGSGEQIQEKPTIDKFYDTESILYSLEKTFRGYQKKGDEWVKLKGIKEIARDEFINVTINSLRSVINSENIISKKTAEEIEIILLEKNLEFIDLCEDEMTLEEDYLETVINIYDHALELFMGLVQGGHGAQTLKEIYAGVANSMEKFHSQNEDSVLRLAVGDKDVFNYGLRQK